jgi:hypothetical protein
MFHTETARFNPVCFIHRGCFEGVGGGAALELSNPQAPPSIINGRCHWLHGVALTEIPRILFYKFKHWNVRGNLHLL